MYTLQSKVAREINVRIEFLARSLRGPLKFCFHFPILSFFPAKRGGDFRHQALSHRIDPVLRCNQYPLISRDGFLYIWQGQSWHHADDRHSRNFFLSRVYPAICIYTTLCIFCCVHYTHSWCRDSKPPRSGWRAKWDFRLGISRSSPCRRFSAEISASSEWCSPPRVAATKEGKNGLISRKCNKRVFNNKSKPSFAFDKQANRAGRTSLSCCHPRLPL